MANGYTKAGYPIVWLKKHSHEECMKMAQERGMLDSYGQPVRNVQAVVQDVIQVVPAPPPQPVATGSTSSMSFRLYATDDRNFTLDIDGYVTYHSSLLESLKKLKNVNEKRILQGVSISSLEEVIKLVVDSNKALEELFNSKVVDTSNKDTLHEVAQEVV